MAEEKSSFEGFKGPYIHQEYPKILYRKMQEGEQGDVKSPAYEKIAIVDGTPQRVVEFHPYVTTVVANKKEAEAAEEDGWKESVAEALAPIVAEPEKPRRGRPPKEIEPSTAAT